ncbi:NAD(P)-binding protein [Dichomitus squalens LYAD-421 SS1]|uniref:NAD(P)-binding protein n=1 Tax=Dichomitus squalens (strain LYAD-421) TaxID=732165 RepID=UPI0004412AFD|nr:NAD(P)-binding protein [Dichomitus squalens LYAD-421 SS1]EJF62915.1 NAD(P)-binding protein [Dichomitus squalens LYAD-421 SS1]
MPTILITGAAGRTSGYVLRALLESKSVPPSDIRLFVRSQGAFALGDYLEASTLPPALKGVDIVFHNGPAFHALESAMGIALIDAAKQAGVKHFVYCSVLYSVLTKMVNHKAKFYVEEHLIESGLNFTILQPSSLMQNFNLERAVSTGVLPAMYNPKTLQGYLDLQDLAEIARLVILSPGQHNRARYDLVGENATFEDVAREISTAAGKDIKIESILRDQVMSKGATHLNIASDYGTEGLSRMLFYYDRRGIPGSNNIARWLLGREPTSISGRIRRDIQEFHG